MVTDRIWQKWWYVGKTRNLPIQLSLPQLTKPPGPPYYCLYSLFNKIRDKGKTVSAWKRGVGVRGRGQGEGGVMTQSLYAHINKGNKKKKWWYGGM
jgi:hypothetical protein